MVRTRVFSSILIAASVLALTACATEPRAPLLEKKFQRAAATYQKYDVQGQTVYCKKGDPASFSRLPGSGLQCVTEAQLREEVETFERTRHRLETPMHATISSIG